MHMGIFRVKYDSSLSGPVLTKGEGKEREILRGGGGGGGGGRLGCSREVVQRMKARE